MSQNHPELPWGDRTRDGYGPNAAQARAKLGPFTGQSWAKTAVNRRPNMSKNGLNTIETPERGSNTNQIRVGTGLMQVKRRKPKVHTGMGDWKWEPSVQTSPLSRDNIGEWINHMERSEWISQKHKYDLAEIPVACCIIRLYHSCGGFCRLFSRLATKQLFFNAGHFVCGQEESLVRRRRYVYW